MIELIVVVVVVSVLVLFAVATFGDAGDVFDTQNVARELKVNMERARFDSVKRRPSNVGEMAKIVIVGATSFTVSTDRDQDGVLEASESRNIDFSNRSNARIVGNALALPITMVFDRRGNVTSTNSLGIEINPEFTICDGCTSLANADTPTSYVVSLSTSGTVSMYDNGLTPGLVQDPTVTDVNRSADIEPLVSTSPGVIDLTGVGGGSTIPSATPPVATPTPTPMPTPTPIPTPTPTPVPNSTPTPTPVPTPPPVATPTPTPDFCTRNERPDTTGCICAPPMKVVGNGRCK